MSYILEIEEDQNGDQYVTFPEDILEELGWLEGDLLEWNMKGEGITLTKLNNPAGYEVIEE
jgi:bifunctional DNA-binding transcriptional regulator/antitoxin component of YhaV-PrlF toxin-antitoxin module|tara:strand:+ start:294 stop:476 length:183 start_codon:yes stop_codon:yes gene_type:complete